MKLYTSVGPNPNVVRVFLAEKGISVPIQKVDIMAGENRREPYISTVNPHGTCPALELDDGTHLSQITAICEYLEETHPSPPLIGPTPEQRAETRMWVRRIDLGICEPMGVAFRSSEGLQMFKDRIFTIPEAADALKNLALMLFSFTGFGAKINQPINADHQHVLTWFDRVAARPGTQK